MLNNEIFQKKVLPSGNTVILHKKVVFKSVSCVFVRKRVEKIKLLQLIVEIGKNHLAAFIKLLTQCKIVFSWYFFLNFPWNKK